MDPVAARSQVGVLLSHGFGGTPAGVQPWADHLTSLGHDVEVPLLPGHGTTWQQMAKTTWRDWYGALTAVSYTHLTLPTNREV